jgi:hypothetical protein
VTLRNYQPVAWVLYQRVIDQSKAAIFINPGINIYVLYVSVVTWAFVVVHDLDLDLHEKINRNKRTLMVIIFFSHLLFFFPAS